MNDAIGSLLKSEITVKVRFRNCVSLRFFCKF